MQGDGCRRPLPRLADGGGAGRPHCVSHVILGGAADHRWPDSPVRPGALAGRRARGKAHVRRAAALPPSRGDLGRGHHWSRSDRDHWLRALCFVHAGVPLPERRIRHLVWGSLLGIAEYGCADHGRVVAESSGAGWRSGRQTVPAVPCDLGWRKHGAGGGLGSSGRANLLRRNRHSRSRRPARGSHVESNGDTTRRSGR